MTSSTLYRQGDDLDTLLGELSEEHGNRVRIVAVDEERPSGRRGFLSRPRVSVQYRVDLADESTPAPAGDPLAELIAQAEAAETDAPSAVRSPAPSPARVPAPAAAAAPATPEANAEFASMLLELAAKKAAERRATTSAPTRPRTSTLPTPATLLNVPTPKAAPKPLTSPSPANRPTPADRPSVANRPTPADRPSVANRPSPAHRPTPTTEPAAADRPSPSTRPRPRPAQPAATAVTAPATKPVAAPVAKPIAAPVAAPVAKPITAPIAELIAELAAPIAKPAAPVRSIPPAIERPAAFVAASPPPPISGSDAALVLRRQLADIGVPVHMLPSASVDPVAAVTTIVAGLPEMPRLPAGRHTLLALVGASADLVLAARRLGSDLGVPADRVWIAGLPADALPAAFDLEDATEAATAARWARADSGDLIVALIATDVPRTASPNQQPARILDALEPDAVWAVIDATRKPADTRRRLAEVSDATGALVIRAAETTSPASVLELGLPIAMLDGEPATRRRWIAALLAALTDQES